MTLNLTASDCGAGSLASTLFHNELSEKRVDESNR